MENLGVPTAPMATAHFADYVTRDSRIHGLPLRYSFPPHPTAWQSRETLHQYVEGNDPITNQPLMQEVIDALIRPLTEQEKNSVPLKKPQRPRLLAPDTEDNLQTLFIEKGWTDGLPIVLPTEERVTEMLNGTDHDPQEIVGRMSVTPHEEKLEYTVEKVAVNAVMAGARPEHFPVILALAATQRPCIPSSTGSWAHMIVINGPIRNQIGMNCGSSALSPFNYANAVIGRAGTLMSINFGDINLSENFTGGCGNNINYNNMCCGENEERSPWEPFQVQQGFKSTDNTLSLFRGWSVQGFSVGSPRHMAEVMAGIGYANATFLVDPLVARNLKKEGFQAKKDLIKYLQTQVKGVGQDGLPLKEALINIIVLGGEWNPIWVTTDFVHIITEPIDKWIPKSGVRKDAHLRRMPAQVNCSDGTCHI